MLNCQGTTRLISESLERELSLSERASSRFHTIMCAGCRRFGVHAQLLRTIAREYLKVDKAEIDRKK